MIDYNKIERSIGVYIISQNGLCFKSLLSKNLQSEIKTDEDLVAPFLTGFDEVVKQAFKSELEELMLRDDNGNKMRIYLKKFKDKTTDTESKVVAVVKGENSSIDIKDKLMKIYIALKDNNWCKYLKSNAMTSDVSRTIENKLRNILYH